MPYDPSLPQPGTEIDADQMRGQFNGLKDLIDAVSGVTSAQVDVVNTLPAGSAASVMVSVSGTVLHLSFDLPQGSNGSNGSDGVPGMMGPPGPPFTNFVVDGVSTLNPWEVAYVNTSFDGSAVRLSYGIPRGNDGATGTTGNDGATGAQGPQGEVSNAQLQAAIDGSSANSNSVAQTGLTVNDPPTQFQVQQIASKLDELIQALRR